MCMYVCMYVAQGLGVNPNPEQKPGTIPFFMNPNPFLKPGTIRSNEPEPNPESIKSDSEPDIFIFF